MELNQWDKVMELSKDIDNVDNISKIMFEYTNSLIQSGNPLLAIEVYDKAKQHQLAAKALTNLAQQVVKRKVLAYFAHGILNIHLSIIGFTPKASRHRT